MDVVPLRQFLCSKVYASKEEVFDAPGRDGGVEAFCQCMLALWDR